MTFASFKPALFTLSACLLALCTAAAADTANSVNAYALRLPLTTTPGAPLHRLQLPAKALIALQTQGYADVRVFNASGQAVPMALSPAPRPDAARQQVALPSYPLLGTASAASAMDGVALRIEERTRNGQTERVVSVNTPAASAPAASQTIGALLDARATERPAVALVINADVPAGQPITFTVASSADLAHWQPLADTVLFRADAGTKASASASSNSGLAPSASLGSSTLSFAPTRLAGQYLRVTWANAAGQLAAVTLRSATLVTAADAPVTARPTATVASPVLTSPHSVSFSLPFATPVTALQVRPEGNNVVIPLRVLGRQEASGPWQPLASTVAYSLQSASKLQTSGLVALPGIPVHDVKLEADPKTPGFAAPPEVTLQFEPVQLVFVASGPAPFTLAVGLAQAANAWLPLGTLLPPGPSGPADVTLQAAALPLATVADGDASPAVITAAPVHDGPPTRSLVLWGVLVAGALALGLMAWVLVKQTRSASSSEGGAGPGVGG